MLNSREPFFMQTSTQDHLSASAQRHSFVASTPERSSIGQHAIAPSAYALCGGSLTPRETDILELQGKGLSMKGIARELDISPGTVKWHVRNLYGKLHASSRDEALFKARQRQLIR